MNTLLTQKETLLRTIGVAVLWISIMLSAALLWLWRDAVALTTDIIFAQKAYSAESENADHPALLLASLEYKTDAPSERQVALFGLILDNLNASCISESREEIARALLSAKREAYAHGTSLSLKTAARIVQGFLPKTPAGSGSCVEVTHALETYESF